MRQLQMDFVMNSMTSRWLRILNTIEKEPTFTLVSLSERLAVSQRTLVKDINQIRQYFDDSIDLQARPVGFHFKERKHMCYLDKKIDLVDSEILFEVMGQVFKGDLKTVQELAHVYNYGESTFRRFLTRTEKALKGYDLHFSLKPVELIGNEENIRKFFFDFYYMGEHTQYTIRPPKELHSLVLNQFSEQLGHYEIGTGLPPSAVYFLLYLMICRIQQNQYVSIVPWVKEQVEKEKDFQLLYSLQDQLFQEFGVTVPKEEFVWLYLVFVTQRTINNREQERRFYERYNRWPSVKKLAENYFSDPQFDDWDRKSLTDYLTSFLVSKSLTQIIHPIWNKQQIEEVDRVKNEYSETYQENYQFLKKYQRVLKFPANYFEDIVVGFTLFSTLLVKAYQPRKRIIFLLEGDALTVQEIRQNAIQHLEKSHHLLFLQLKELTMEQVISESIDLVVTNYRPYLWDFPIEKGFVLINTPPNDSDWLRITQQINRRLPSTNIKDRKA